MTLSGAPIQLAYLVQWLRANGWTTTVVAPEPGPLADKLHGVEIIYDSQLLIDPAYGALRRLAPQFDLVVANTIATWEAVQASQFERVPALWYVHETQVGRELMKLVHMIEPSLELANTVVTPTQTTAEMYACFRSKPIEVIPYGIPEVAVRPPRVAGQPTFAIIGTFEPRKGQDVLLDAVERVSGSALFKLAGRTLDEAFYGELRRRANALSNVELLDSLGHEEAMQLLAASDVLVCPSRDETMPIVLLEAMSLGKAIICTNVGGIAEWIRDGENGMLIPSEDTQALATAIERVIRDDELRAKLGAAARATFDRYFTIEEYGRRFAALIRATITP